MTTPTPHGYPDWGRFEALADIQHLNESGISVAANTQITRGPYFVGLAEAVGIDLSSNSNRAKVTAQWYNDQGLTEQLSQYGLTIQPGGDFSRAIPNIGPWVRIAIDAPTAVDTEVDLAIFNARTPGAHQLAEATNVLMSVTGGAVAALSTSTTTISTTWPGPAAWHVSTALGSWTARLKWVDKDGVAVLFDVRSVGGTIATLPTELPPAGIQAEFSNQTAAAGTYNMYLVGRSPHSGA